MENNKILNIFETMQPERISTYKANGFIPYNEFVSLLDSLQDKFKCFSSKDSLKLYDNLSSGVFIFNSQETLYLNSAVKLILMNDNNENEFECISRLVYSEDKAKFDSLFNFEFDTINKATIRVLTSSSIIKWLNFTVEKIVYQDSPAVLMIFEDVSVQIKNELQQELISKMMIDTEAKSMNTSVLLQKTAKFASVGLIAGGITHEINQPLNAIKVGSDGLMIWNTQHPGMFPDKIAKVINAISISASKIDNILKHLRSYWIETGESSPHKVSLNAIIKNAVEMMQQKMTSHDVRLILNLPDADVYSNVFPIDLELVLDNLIISAINSLDNFPNKSDKFIKIDLVKGSNAAEIIITDNGSDVSLLSSEMVSNLNLNKNSNSSTSIELSIVKILLIGMNTEISISGYENQGAVISLKLNIIV